MTFGGAPGSFETALEAVRRTAAGGGLDAANVAWAALFFGVTFVGSFSAVVFVLVKLPADYFCVESRLSGLEPRSRSAVARRIGKNLAGAVLVVAGLLLSIPGVPGQGLLTVLIGTMLLDFPGKRALERRIARIPSVLSAMNRLRARFNRAPLVLE